MPRAPKSPPIEGAILPFAEAERLRRDPKFQGQLKATWGFGDRSWYPHQRRVLTALEDEIGMFGGVGGGKAQPLTSMVSTPYGFKAMGDLKLGDNISSVDGSTCQVIGIYPQGVKPILRVRFADGTETRCTEDHLWLAKPTTKQLKTKYSWGHDADEAWPELTNARVYTASDLRERVAKCNSSLDKNGWRRYGYQVPLTKPVVFAGPAKRKFDAYVLGVLLGDGGIANGAVRLSSADAEIIQEVERRLGTTLRHAKAYDYAILGLQPTLRELGLLGCKSGAKFIPETYQTADVETRLDLMAGLLDTDGYVDARGHVSFTTVSPQLAKDITRMARGLGARASIRLKTNVGYRDANGDKIVCQDAYTIYISTPLVHKMFKLSRKLARLRPAECYATWKVIESIEPDGEEAAQCISVSHPTSLYLTDDFTVTHNTITMMAWLISGNPHLPAKNPDGTPNLVNISYMHHPSYYALILRENEKDLWQFIAKAREMYEPMGIVYTQGMFRHPSGGTIVCGHMADQTAWQKYLGNEYVRIAIDEAPLIPDLGLYEELRARNRSVYPELRTQILLAGNYGGKGSQWVFDRFMNCKRKDGTPYEKGETIEEHVTDPDTGEFIMTRTRVWIFSSYKDNPKFTETPRYRAILASLTDPRKRAAYMKGEWNVFTGSYFGEVWRKDWRGEDSHEPPHAFHVITKAKTGHPMLEPWFSRAIGLDWGFRHDAAITWLAQHGLTKQIHGYRELAAPGISSERLGFELARLTLDELNAHPQHAITVHLSHDAFRKDDNTHTTAEMIMRGIARVIGPEAVHAPDLVIKQLQESYSQGAMPTPAEEVARAEAIENLRKRRLAGITLRVATKINALGWHYIRDLMRWEELVPQQADFNPELAMQLLTENRAQYDEYLRSFHTNVERETLPKLQIWDSCPKLIDAIPKLQYKGDDVDDASPDHFPGKDSVDSLHYGLIGFRDEALPEPWEAYRAKKLNTVLAQNPNVTTADLVWVNRHLEAEWAKQESQQANLVLSHRGRRRNGFTDPNSGLLM